jgi:hypothetical protein
MKKFPTVEGGMHFAFPPYWYFWYNRFSSK